MEKDVLHCEEQLRTSLHCDDKEKLRRKLALLKREYLKTSQRLQRAQRSEAVRRHVRTRILHQNQLDQRNPEAIAEPCLKPSSPTLHDVNGITSGGSQTQGHNGMGLPDTETCRRSQVVRFLLPSEAACRHNPDSNGDIARGPTPSSASCLRSHSSWLHWEQQRAVAGSGTDSSKAGQSQSETAEAARTEGREVIECEELPSESSSLLLTRQNIFRQTGTRRVEGRETQMVKETGSRAETRSYSLLQMHLNSSKDAEGRGQDEGQSRGRAETERREGNEDSKEQRDGHLSEDVDETTEQNAGGQIDSETSHNDVTEIKGKKSELIGGEHHGKVASVLDSCTLLDGLLFPAEYYVRTTRRMMLSKSQPNVQAIILSQLRAGQQYRVRGSSRGSHSHTHRHRASGQNSGTHLSSQTSTSPSVELNSQGSSGASHQTSAQQKDMDTKFTPATARAVVRGRRGGRGRGRPQTYPCSPCLAGLQLGLDQTPNNPPCSSPLLSSSLSLHGADRPKCCLSRGEAVPVLHEPQPSSAPSTTSHSASGVTSHYSLAPGQQLYPIFLKNSRQMRSSTGLNSLLFPSSPPTQKSLLSFPSLSLSPLISKQANLDITLDFYLPDDQFASLKLHKLRQVAAQPAVECFRSPLYNKQRTVGCLDICHTSRDPVMSLPLPCCTAPTISSSPNPSEQTHTCTQSAHLQNLEAEARQSETEQSWPLTDQAFDQTRAAGPREQQTGRQCQSNVLESVSVVQDSADHCMKQGEHTDIMNSHSQSSVSARNIHTSTEASIKPQRLISFTDRPAGGGNNNGGNDNVIGLSQEEHADCPAVSQSMVDQGCTSSPADVRAKHSEESSKPNRGSKPLAHCVPSQLLLSPPPPSTSLLPSQPPSLALPSLGLSPHLVHTAVPLTCSPHAPALTRPSPYHPSTQALSPPVLSPCPSFTPTCSSQPSAPLAAQILDSILPSQGSGGQTGLRTEETTGEHAIRSTHTLKVPAGGSLVDACCLPASSGTLFVAAAGKWAVCLWSQNAASNWSLIHTWAFSEMVINVFPIPDAAGLMCVTLGKLEIREVWLLSCCSLSQMKLCEGLLQAVIGASKSRVVTSSHAIPGLQVFTLMDGSSTLSSLPLACPGVGVGALASVDGHPDALVGTDDSGHLFIWNLMTGQLLQRISLGDCFSHTACLRGYSYNGAILVLMQHQFLRPLEKEEEEREATAPHHMFLKKESRTKAALFSLVAVNPLSGKSLLASRLYAPRTWSGRLCDADTHGSSVVGLSQSGCVCVWELCRGGVCRMVGAPEVQGWHLARWGGRGTLLTGHHNGDITLHCCSTGLA